MLKKKLSKLRRKLFEAIGSDIYSRPSLLEIDRKLEHYLNYRNGFFIEVGANNGFNQSNTYYFEKFKGWKGILVEGMKIFRLCRDGGLVYWPTGRPVPRNQWWLK